MALNLPRDGNGIRMEKRVGKAGGKWWEMWGSCSERVGVRLEAREPD